MVDANNGWLWRVVMAGGPTRGQRTGQRSEGASIFVANHLLLLSGC